jgi:hypothetical protein
MKPYLSQLLIDITEATENLAWPYLKREALSLHDVRSREEEDRTAPVRNLPVWTGIAPEMLPPENMLSDEEVLAVLNAMIRLLKACNCHVVYQTTVPERFQYESIRQNFDQDVKVYEWNDGFFVFCKAGTKLKTCALGEYCQCAFYEELFADMVDEQLTPEEERARELEWEVRHIQKKYGDDWMKYYPYHLDKDYDDADGNPHDYGFGKDDEDDDTWWRK